MMEYKKMYYLLFNRITDIIDELKEIQIEAEAMYIDQGGNAKIEIKQIITAKKDYLDLLLLADEQESMIDKYLAQGQMFALYFEQEVRAICVVTDEGGGTLEIKNIATKPKYQGQGYGRQLIDFIISKYSGNFDKLIVGTGDSPATIPFYQKCGFKETHRIKNFFTDNYNHPIYEAGKLLTDMVYLARDI